MALEFSPLDLSPGSSNRGEQSFGTLGIFVTPGVYFRDADGYADS